MRGQVESRRLWAKIRVASREVLTEEQPVPLLAQRQPPSDAEALADLRDHLKGLFSSQAARGHIERIRAWEARVRQAWISKPSDVSRLVREPVPGRTAFLKREDGTLTGNWAEMQELAQGAWTSQVY